MSERDPSEGQSRRFQPRGCNRPCRARPADRSLVAEDRSARGAHDTDRNPESAHVVLTRPSDTGGNSVGQLPGRGDGTAQVARPSRWQVDTLEPHSNDS